MRYHDILHAGIEKRKVGRIQIWWPRAPRWERFVTTLYLMICFGPPYCDLFAPTYEGSLASTPLAQERHGGLTIQEPGGVAFSVSGGSATNKQRYDSSKRDEMGFHVSTDGDISHESKCYEFLMMRRCSVIRGCQDWFSAPGLPTRQSHSTEIGFWGTGRYATYSTD